MSYPYYRWKWENYPRLGFIERVPIHLDLELVAGRCNYRCGFCEMSFNPPEPIDMPFNMATKIIDEFAEKGGSSIKFVYLGEPLLCDYLADIIWYAKKKGILETIIATNAGLLNEYMSKELITAGLDWITYSVDSSIPEVYRNIRINGNLKNVAQNIRSFYKIRKSLGSKTPKIVIQCIRQKLNEDEIDSGRYKDFWKSYVDEISISKLINYHLNEIHETTPDFRCTSPFRRLTIRANGDLAICCGMRSDVKIVGNINENSIEEVWLGPKFNKIRELMLEGKAHLIDICKNCPARLIHIQGGERFEKIKK